MATYAAPSSASTKRVWTGRVLSALGALFLLFDGIIHILKITPVVEAFAQLGYPLGTARAVGVIEITSVALYLLPRTSLLAAMCVVASSAPAQQRASRRAGGRRAFVNGVNMYYLVQGRGGVPLVLLHGAFSNIQTDFGKMLPTLSKNRQVIAIEQQGHGHTPDIDRPLTYEQMADDVAELLRQLRITKADFFGYSMGGAIGTYVAVRHPELVRKLIFAGGASYNVDGFYPELMEGEKKLAPADLAGTPWQRA